MIRDDLESFIDQAMYHTQEPGWLAIGIIDFIESKLPMVEEECQMCHGEKLKWVICSSCKDTGKTTRRMTLDEAIRRLNENALQ